MSESEIHPLIIALVERRQKSSISMQKLADAAGMQRLNLSHIERGMVSPTLRTYERLKMALKHIEQEREQSNPAA